MGTGYLRIHASTAFDALPVRAHVIVKTTDEKPLFETVTNENGNTAVLALPAPDVSQTFEPNRTEPAYSVWNVLVEAKGYVTIHIKNVEVVDTQTAILPVQMHPLSKDMHPIMDENIDIPPVSLLIPGRRNPVGPPSNEPIQRNSPAIAVDWEPNSAPSLDPAPVQDVDQALGVQPTPRVASNVVIPTYITVHLGTPTNTAARNVTVPFVDYVKNVTSSEIYSTWPESSLRANIHAIISFALNRVYTEWYRSRGFVFDITNSTSYDMYYRDGGPVFENISRLVDEIFNVYARRYGFEDPFFTEFCNGTTATCPGMSQWGTVTLANQGKSPIEILRYYYRPDMELVSSNNITGITESYPGYALTVGSQGGSVLRIQNFLNRIRVNFPLIPLISNPNGVFGTDTRDAVITFQRTFNLTPDGVVERSTWNKISFIFVGIAKLAELTSEGVRMSVGVKPPNVVLSQGSTGPDVLELQFILDYIAPYYNTIPSVIKDSVFGASVKNAVIEFQKTFNLTPDGVVGAGTWNKLYAVYHGIRDNAIVPPQEEPEVSVAYPGTPLRVGSTGQSVRLMQTYLNTIRIVYTSIPLLTVDGVFGEETRQAVVAFQREFLLAVDGVIGPITWNKIVEQFQLLTGGSSVSLDYPGTPLRVGSSGSAVRLMQGFLRELSAFYPSIPVITVDGIFGSNTRAAVVAFQNLFGLTPDGVIGPVTWNAIVERRNAVV